MRRIVSTALCWAVLVLCAAAAPALAKVIYVDDDAPAPGDGTSWATAYRFLQDALAEGEFAEKPVEIHVAQGLYKPDRNQFAPEGTGNTDVMFRLVDGMSLLGGYAGLAAADPNVRDFQVYETILSGDLAGNDAEVTDPTLLRDDPTRDENSWQVVLVRNGQSRLEGFTITGGTAGGVFVDQYPRDVIDDVTVSECKFYGNRGSETDTPSGGALTTWLNVVESGVVVRRSSFVGNAGETGAILAQEILLDQCRFERNYSWGESGGAASLTSKSTVRNCRFICNSARQDAGALRVSLRRAGVTRVVGCLFRQNSAGRVGGAIVCEDDVDIASCTFTGNGATTRGGACVHSGGDAIVTHCVFAGNRAGDVGGAWSSGWRSSLEIANCTAVGNDSDEGHFLAINLFLEESTSPFCVRNSILFDGNDAIWSNEVPVELSYSCVSEDTADLEESKDWLLFGPGVIECDPGLVDPGYWDANGTPGDPNDDFFVEGDYHLKSQAGRWDEASGSWVQDDVTSPCIDAGDPNSPVMYEPFPNGGVINMGAYGGTAQASKSYFGTPLCGTIIAGDINGDCRVDIADVVILLDHWLETGAKAEE